MSIESKHAYRFIYLKSDHWNSVRIEALAREGGKCEICGQESISNDAHHIWYPENIYDTTERHLAILCRPCHEFLHAVCPESRTRDEDIGLKQWKILRNAVIVWRKEKISLFQTGLEYQPPSNLRKAYEDLKERHARALDKLGALEAGGCNALSIEQEYQVMRGILKKWYEEKKILTSNNQEVSGRIVALG